MPSLSRERNQRFPARALSNSEDSDATSLSSLFRVSRVFAIGRFTLRIGGESRAAPSRFRDAARELRLFVASHSVRLDTVAVLASPDFQQIRASDFNGNLFINLDGTLSYSNLRSSLGAVDPEKGIRAGLRSTATYSAGNIYPRAAGTLDLGFQLPINHSSIWLRTAAGKSFTNMFNPFTRFAFAAFGNNYVDYQPARRYRTAYSFPGLSFDASTGIIAREFAKSMLEWVLPPIRFRELGGLNMYSNWMQVSVFSSALLTADTQTMSNRFFNVGSQLDMKIVIFSLLESTLSVGFASAFDLNNGNKQYKEWMVSLKLLR